LSTDSKFRYHIYPDRIYIIYIDGTAIEVTGQEILSAYVNSIDISRRN